MKIALIGCVKTKQSFSCEAERMYISPLFRKTVEFIKKQKYDKWYILSALYGLIDNKKIIDPYNLALNSFSQKQLRDWSAMIFKSIMDLQLNNLSFLCGERYCNEYLLSLLDSAGIKYDKPFDKMPMGVRLAFLSSNNKEIKTNHTSFGFFK